MENLNQLRDGIPEPAKDIKLNVAAVLTDSSLSLEQRWGVAVACAFAARNEELAACVVEDAKAAVPEAVIDDARAAAALMAMNNVYYRFRHLVGKDGYSAKPPRLRMNRIAKPATSKVDFELYCLAVSAINGCETCVQAHERVVVEGGLSEDQVHDAIRIAASVHGAAVALEV